MGDYFFFRIPSKVVQFAYNTSEWKLHYSIQNSFSQFSIAHTALTWFLLSVNDKNLWFIILFLHLIRKLNFTRNFIKFSANKMTAKQTSSKIKQTDAYLYTNKRKNQLTSNASSVLFLIFI